MPVSSFRQARVGWLSIALGGVLAAGMIAWSAAPLDSLPPDGGRDATATPTLAAPVDPSLPQAVQTAGEARQFAIDGEYERAALGYRQLAAGVDGSTRAEYLLAAAVALTDAGETGEALPVLRDALAVAPKDTELATRIAYLLGRRLNEAGDHAAAADVLDEVVDHPESPILAFALYEFGVAEAALGHEDKARDAWDGIDDEAAPAKLLGAVALARAEMAASDGDTDENLEWLQRYVEYTPSSAGRLVYAAAAREAGDAATWETQLRLVVVAEPGSHESVVALQALDEAGIDVEPGLAGQVLYRAGMYDEARKVLEPAVEAKDVEPSDMARRLFYLAATHEDLGELDEAVTFYDRAAAVGGDSPFVHRSKWWAAVVTGELGKTADASARYRALALDGPPGEFSAAAAFRSGKALLDSGDPAAAAAAWDGLESVGGVRVQYWRAQALVKAGDVAGAQALEERIVADGGRGFYAMEAARALGQPVPDAGTYRPLPADVGPDWGELEAWIGEHAAGPDAGAGVAGARTAKELTGLGLRDDARDVLLREAGGDPWAILAMLRAARDAGLVDTGIVLARRLEAAVGAEAGAAPVSLRRLEYPIDYVEQIGGLAREYDIDPRLLAAMVWAESSWFPRAGSHAGALGLTQVMPETGAGIAQGLGMEDFETDDLFRPAVSLRLGAYYLSVQMDAYPHAAAALAAYNAGPGNADRWLDIEPGSGMADFVETIDYDETYGYVHTVLDAYGEYDAAYTVSDGS
jgi:soluble lytic murein transglycosylase